MERKIKNISAKRIFCCTYESCSQFTLNWETRIDRGCVESIEKEGLNTKASTTDKHVQTWSYMKKCRPDIKRQFHIWHVSRDIKKKLQNVSKKSDLSVQELITFRIVALPAKETPSIWKRNVSVFYITLSTHMLGKVLLFTNCVRTRR